ncbi:MAG: hypothetical protein ABI091_26945 [Ferruginibacter sp.]
MQTQRNPQHKQAKVIEMDCRNIYQQNGYKDRQEYLNSLSDQYGVDSYSLDCIADMLGENEDFDGLVSSLEDFSLLL